MIGQVALLAIGICAPTLVDRGIFPDLDSQVSLTLPARDEVRKPRLGMSARRNVLLLFAGDYPLAAFALPERLPEASGTWGALSTLLPAQDARVLSAWFTPSSRIEPLSGTDADGDG